MTSTRCIASATAAQILGCSWVKGSPCWGPVQHLSRLGLPPSRWNGAVPHLVPSQIIHFCRKIHGLVNVVRKSLACFLKCVVFIGFYHTRITLFYSQNLQVVAELFWGLRQSTELRHL